MKYLFKLLLITYLIFKLTSCTEDITDNKTKSQESNSGIGIKQSIEITERIIEVQNNLTYQIDSMKKVFETTDSLANTIFNKPLKLLTDTNYSLELPDDLSKLKIMIAGYDTSLIIESCENMTRDSITKLLESFTK